MRLSIWAHETRRRQWSIFPLFFCARARERALSRSDRQMRTKKIIIYFFLLAVTAHGRTEWSGQQWNETKKEKRRSWHNERERCEREEMNREKMGQIFALVGWAMRVIKLAHRQCAHWLQWKWVMLRYVSVATCAIRQSAGGNFESAAATVEIILLFLLFLSFEKKPKSL